MFDTKEMTTTIKTQDLLRTLKLNKERHKAIVDEARAGYLKKAKEAIKERMSQLDSGKIVSLSFNLTPPQDHTEDYEVAIEMFTAHTEDTVTLSTQQFRELYLDKWNWKRQFLVGNAMYSKTASDTVGASFDANFG